MVKVYVAVVVSPLPVGSVALTYQVYVVSGFRPVMVVHFVPIMLGVRLFV